MSHPKADNGTMSFWDHLDVLRASLIRILIVTVACGLVAFLCKEEVFSILLAPRESHFITYRFLEHVNHWLTGNTPTPFSVQLINTGLAEQLIIHLKTSIHVGLLLSSPYALYLLFRFISPALYTDERRYSTRVVCWGYLMFLLGVLLSYFLLFPLTFRFLATYQVTPDVPNLITLQSYISTLLSMSLTLGLVFELPMLCWLLAKLGILTSAFMMRFRRHAIILILILAAIITPTADMFTMTIVALPIWLLYEASILIVRHTHFSRHLPA